ncbi:MAG: hypothetical protein ACYC6L_04000, partial [Anaerolineae bacterium]
YLRARSTNRWQDWLLVQALLLGALISHESGIVLPLAVIVFEAFAAGSVRPNKPMLRSLQLLVTPILYLVLWWFVIPKRVTGFQLAAVSQNILPVLQYLTYPLVPLLSLLPTHGWMLITLTAAVVLGGALLTIHTRWFRLWLGSLAWYVLALAPAVLLLDPAYIQHSVYLGYFSAPGVALFWAAVLGALLGKAQNRIVRGLARVGAAGLAAALVITPIPYIVNSLNQDVLTNRIIQSMAAIARQTPSDQALSFVNLPYYWEQSALDLAAAKNPYPWFSTANIVIPAYSSAGDVVWANGGLDRSVQAYQYAGVLPQWVTTGAEVSASGLYARLSAEQIYALDLASGAFIHLNEAMLSAYSGTSLQQRYVQQMAEPPEFATQTEVNEAAALDWRLGNALELVGCQVKPSAVLPGENVDIMLYWRKGAHPEGNPGIILRLRDRYGSLLVERNFFPVAGLDPVDWEAGRLYASRLSFQLPANSSLGPAGLSLAVQPSDRGLITFYDAGGQVLADEARFADFLVGRVSALQGTNAIPSHQLNASLDGQIQLLGYDVSADKLSAGAPLTVTLYWQPEQILNENLTVFVHLVGVDGVPIAQHDSEPNNGMYPTSSWQVGQVIPDEHILTLPAELAEGEYKLLVGMYRWPSLDRLPVKVNDQADGDTITLQTITIQR